ncbi:MAG: MFS transporter [Lachnospiraceae bacterium]|nr:MFS transporter [Lachnospiraceae bacterium]
MKEKLWTGRYIHSLLLVFGVNVGVMLLHSVVAVYGTTLAASTVVGGYMITAFQVSAMLTRFVVKPLSERYTNKQLLLFGVIMTIIAGIGYCTTTSIPVFLIFRALHAFGFSLGLTCATAISTECIPHTRLSEGLGFTASASTLGTAIGPMVAIEILGDGYTNWQSLFICIVIVSVITLIGSVIFKYTQRKREPGQQREVLDKKKTSYKGLIVAGVFMFAGITQSAINGYLTSFAKEMNLGNISLYFTVMAVFTLGVRFVSVKVQEKIGMRMLVYISALSMGLGVFGVAFARSAAFVILMAVPFGIGMGFLYPIFNYRILRTVDVTQHAFGASMYYCAMDIAYGIGGFMWGYVAQAIGSNMVFIIGGSLILVMLVLDTFIYKKWDL